MKPVHTFSVVPSLPPAIEGLRTVAYNLRWCWSHESVELFRRLDATMGKDRAQSRAPAGHDRAGEAGRGRQGRRVPGTPAPSRVES